MSVLGKKWLIRNADSDKSIIDKLLENRGVSSTEEKESFINPEFHSPFLFEDMEKAVDRIKKAIENQERIIVFGDYDVDGISSTAIAVNALQRIGAEVSYRLPHRMDDGYGLSNKFIEEFAEKGVKLVITVDCGISCHEQVSLAAEKGIDIIITDHHTVPTQIPEKAHSILHPLYSNYPFPDLTGAGVAFKLAQGLAARCLPEDEAKELVESLIDLASLGTLADLGKLKGENRFIVKEGLKKLANTKWIGLKKIMELASVKESELYDTSKVAFRIVPRINAAGRIGDPYIALSLLLQDNHSEKVELLGEKLEELNNQRQVMTKLAIEQAIQGLDENNLPPILVAHNPEWHVGILGLVASRLAEKYAKPAIVMQDFGDTLVASARSPQFFNIVEALKHCENNLMSFGGHAQAAGFSLKKENLESFTDCVTAYAHDILQHTEFSPTIQIDCSLNSAEIDFSLIDQIEKLQPFGVENEKPTFILHGVEPNFIDNVGKEGEHLKFSLPINGQNVQVIGFRMGEFVQNLRDHRKIDLVFHLERNLWNNKEYIQLHAIDFCYNAGLK